MPEWRALYLSQICKERKNMVERGSFSGKSMNQVIFLNGHYLQLTYQHCTLHKPVKKKGMGEWGLFSGKT
jgi:hypothetical protein